MSPSATHRRQQMRAGRMENRRKQGDGIEQYKLCHPVALNTLPAFAGIPARKVRRDMGRGQWEFLWMLLSGISHGGWGPKHTGAAQGEGNYKELHQQRGNNRKATGDSKITRQALAGWTWETFKLFQNNEGKKCTFLPRCCCAQAKSPLLYSPSKGSVSHRYLTLSSVSHSKGKRLMLLNAGCLLETQYAQVEAECTGDALQPQPGRGGIINLSLDAWHFLWWSNK